MKLGFFLEEHNLQRYALGYLRITDLEYQINQPGSVGRSCLSPVNLTQISTPIQVSLRLDRCEKVTGGGVVKRLLLHEM